MDRQQTSPFKTRLVMTSFKDCTRIAYKLIRVFNDIYKIGIKRNREANKAKEKMLKN
jgi:hypothetical protein